MFCSPVTFLSPHSGQLNLLFGCNAGNVYCLNEMGELVWSTELANGPIVASLTVLPSHLLFSIQKESEELYTLQRKRKLPQQQIPNLGNSSCSLLAVISSKGDVYLLQSDNGRLVHQHSIAGDVFSSPVVYDDCIVFGCRDDNVYCLRFLAE